MITWLPHLKPGENARSLRIQDLHGQVTYTTEILSVLEKARELSPSDDAGRLAVDMWTTSHEWRLCIHGLMCATTLVAERGVGADKIDVQFLAKIGKELEEAQAERNEPPWIGDLDVHRSHRSELIRRDPAYADGWPKTPARMPILWPQIVDSDPRGYRLRLSAADLRRLAYGTRVLPPWLHYDRHRHEVVAE